MMITKPVWFWLPGHVQPVEAGVFVLDGGRGRFTYREEYLARPDRVPLDPFSMPLVPRGAVETRHGGVFGILRDSGPDSWGRAVLEKEQGRDLSEIEILELAPGDSAGAIALGDPAHKQGWKPWKLSDLDSAVDEWDKLQGNAHELARILSPDTGLGGAKPKTTLEHEGELWLAKLPEKSDSPWMPFLEHAALALAKECHIESCESQVKTLPAVGRHALLVKRFDRAASAEGWTRKGFASADTVLRLGDKGIGEPGRNYVAFGQELRRWCGRTGVDAKDQIRELWRRIVFNGLVGNGDDHAKNHGLIQEGGNWRLSPAFDIVPHAYSHQFGLSMPFYLDKSIRSSAVRYDHLILAASDFGYAREEAVQTVESMGELIADKWQGYLLDVPVAERERISPAFGMSKILSHAAKQEIQAGILPERRRGRGGVGR